jgi:general secretion pathway protein F
MPQYEYLGINASGKSVKGKLITENLNAAKSQLRRDGIYPSSIRELSVLAQKDSAQRLGFFKKVSIEDLSLMTRQLATLVAAHVPLVEALSALTDQLENPLLKASMAQVKSDVNEGAPLQKALARFPDIFSPLYSNMIGAGEASGTLDIVLLRLADFLEYQDRLRKKVVGAMIYPIVMIVAGGGAIMVIFVKVIPEIATIFEDNKASLPLITQVMLSLSQFLVSYWWAVILLVGFVYWAGRRYLKSPQGSAWWDRVSLKLPLFGELIRMVAVSRFTKTLATLLRSGIPLLTGLSVVKNVVGNQTIQQAVDQATTDLTEGANIADPLVRSGQFPPLVTHMISVGERTGELESMLEKVSEHYEYQVNTKVESFTRLIEPLLILVMAGVVLLVVLSVILPMLELNNAAL